MIGLLHGYLLDGSGSNLWTQAVARSLCRIGESVHVVCQEAHPERFDFVSEARHYPVGSTRATRLFRRETGYAGECVVHRPGIGETLPVYVTDRYEHFTRVVPMVDLPDHEIEQYVERNAEVVEAVAREVGLRALHANHAVLMSVVARRVAARLELRYAVMPHGSALEYAVKPDPRLREMARAAFEDADAIFVIGREVGRRLREIFPNMDSLERRMVALPLGVDVDLFRPVQRGERRAGAERLAESLEGVGRGKRPEDTARMLAAIARDAEGDGPGEGGGPAPYWRTAAEYERKLPDRDLEVRLGAMDWERDGIILFVGRLIAAKGAQAVIAALPRVLGSCPRARLIIVGHGPLREPLESLVRALGRGDGAMVRRVLREATAVEDDPKSGRLKGTLAWLDALAGRGELAAYLDRAAASDFERRVTFAGYLAHAQLRHLFPLADVAVFPSLVREAGPLVFLEALASEVFPLGTYFGGMADSIDEAGEVLPPEAAERMKLRTPDAEEGGMVLDIAERVVAALADPTPHGPKLRALVERRHDWRAVARRLRDELVGAAGAAGTGGEA